MREEESCGEESPCSPKEWRKERHNDAQTARLSSSTRFTVGHCFSPSSVTRSMGIMPCFCSKVENVLSDLSVFSALFCTFRHFLLLFLDHFLRGLGLKQGENGFYPEGFLTPPDSSPFNTFMLSFTPFGPTPP